MRRRRGDNHLVADVGQGGDREAAMGDRAPIWTEVGVSALGAPGMRVEIRVTAVLGHGG
ncbi:hypothetical protein ACWDWU_45595 [Streptomyces sp. NPDC003442]